MLSSVQKALRNLLVGDGEAVPARGCSRADGVAEPTSPPAPLVVLPHLEPPLPLNAKRPLFRAPPPFAGVASAVVYLCRL